MASYVAGDVVKTMLRRKQRVESARVLVMGFTFKENCPDTRNTKVADLIQELAGLVAEVAVYDPVADVELAKHELRLCAEQQASEVGRSTLSSWRSSTTPSLVWAKPLIRSLLAPNGLIYDIKGILPASASNARL